MIRLAIAIVAAMTVAAVPAAAHHGVIYYDTSKIVTIEGFVSEVMEGFPHWEINVRSEGIEWTLDLDSDIVLKRAGLKPDGSDFTIGRKIKVEGYQVKDPDWYHMAPVRIHLDGKVYPIDVDID